MIKRTPAQATPSAVNNAIEDHLTASKGIREYVPPTELNTVIDAENFDIDKDGTFVLRKPLVRVSTDESIIFNKYIHNKTYRLQIYEDGTLRFMDVNGKFFDSTRILFRFTDTKGNIHDVKIANVFDIIQKSDWENIGVCHSANTTLLTNAKIAINSKYFNSYEDGYYIFDYKAHGFEDTDVKHEVSTDDKYAIVQNNGDTAYIITRYISIYLDLETYKQEYWIIEIRSPEINTIVDTSNTSGPAIEFNLALDRPTAISDLYDYGSVNCNAIIPYVYVESNNITPLEEYQPLNILTSDLYPYKYTIITPTDDTGKFTFKIQGNRIDIPTMPGHDVVNIPIHYQLYANNQTDTGTLTIAEGNVTLTTPTISLDGKSIELNVTNKNIKDFISSSYNLTAQGTIIKDLYLQIDFSIQNTLIDTEVSNTFNLGQIMYICRTYVSSESTTVLSKTAPTYSIVEDTVENTLIAEGVIIDNVIYSFIVQGTTYEYSSEVDYTKQHFEVSSEISKGFYTIQDKYGITITAVEESGIHKLVIYHTNGTTPKLDTYISPTYLYMRITTEKSSTPVDYSSRDKYLSFRFETNITSSNTKLYMNLAYVANQPEIPKLNVRNITEDITSVYSIAESVSTSDPNVVFLKANLWLQKPFIAAGDIINPLDNYICIWERSKDGGYTWETVPEWLNYGLNNGISLEVQSKYSKFFKRATYEITRDSLDKKQQPTQSEDSFEVVEGILLSKMYNPVSGNDVLDYDPRDTEITLRPDVLVLESSNTNRFQYKYRFTIYYIKNPISGFADSKESAETLTDIAVQVSYTPYLSEFTFKPTQLLKIDPNLNYSNSSYIDPKTEKPGFSKHLFINYRLYSYHPDLYVLYASNVNSMVVPYTNTIDLPYGGKIVKIIPWRNYILIFTDIAIYLLQDDTSTNNFSIKMLSGTIGVNDADAETITPLLNSIYFKSKNKIYNLVPNLYGYTDNVMNLYSVSESIEDDLIKFNEYNFGFSNINEYVLMCTLGETTTSYIYNIVTKTWTKHIYPIRLTEAITLTQNDIRLFSSTKEFYYNKTFEELGIDDTLNLPYGDYINFSLTDIKDTLNNTEEVYNQVSRFDFKINFGQKSSNYMLDKQFLETKLIFGSKSERDVFPVHIEMNADGMPHPIIADANVDSALQKQYNIVVQDIGTLNTEFLSDESSAYKTLRQMFIKYSGKGKTISHLITGTSVCRFKFYSLNFRYRILPKKQ